LIDLSALPWWKLITYLICLVLFGWGSQKYLTGNFFLVEQKFWSQENSIYVHAFKTLDFISENQHLRGTKEF